MTASSHLEHAASRMSTATVGQRSASDVVFIVFASCATLLGLCGNVLLVTAIATNKKLRRSANAMNGSLAVADILVEATVMSLCLVNDSMGYWPLGDLMCRVWISLDVMCSTASILSISGIAFDRYLHVRDPFLYDRLVTRRAIIAAIATIWTLSVVISFLPVFLKLNEPSRPDEETAAEVSLAGAMFHSRAATEAYAGHQHSRLNLTAFFYSSPPDPLVAGEDFPISPQSGLLMSPPRHNPQAATVSAVPNASRSLLFESTSGSEDGFPTCKFEANPIYAITSSTISFYIPCVVLVVVYAQLYRIARGHMRSIKGVRRVPRQPAAGSAAHSAFTGSRLLAPATPRTLQRNGSGVQGPSAISSRQSSVDNVNSIRLNGDLLEVHWPPTPAGTSRENSNRSNGDGAPPVLPDNRQQSVISQETAATVTPNSDHVNTFDLMSMSANGSALPASLESSVSTAVSSSSCNPLTRRLSTRRSSFGDALITRSASSNAAAIATAAAESVGAQSNGAAGNGLAECNKHNGLLHQQHHHLLSPHSTEGPTSSNAAHRRKISVSERNLVMVTSPSASSSLNRIASTLLQVPFRLHSSSHQTSHFFRDQKASLTLGVIMSSFFVCWFPFFTINGIRCSPAVHLYCTCKTCFPIIPGVQHVFVFVTVIAPICGNCISGASVQFENNMPS